jgi:dipeptidyl aminopeptidase/acylaminoacyl peptidase
VGCGGGPPAGTPPARSGQRQRLSWLVVGALAILLLASLYFALAHLRELPPTAAAVRFQIAAPEKTSFRVFDVPAISPDGERIAFTAGDNRKGERDLYQKLADGSGPEEVLLEAKDGQKNVEDWSPNGKHLIYNYQPAPNTHLYVLPLGGDRKPVPFLKTAFRTKEGQFSPDGRWLSYSSFETRRSEIYVQRFNIDLSQPRGKRGTSRHPVPTPGAWQRRRNLES